MSGAESIVTPRGCCLTLNAVKETNMKQTLFSLLRNLALVLGGLAAFATQAAPPIAVDSDATRIFESSKPALVHLKVVSVENGVEAASGSGFAVGEPGWMATNYHVVSDVVLKPNVYQLRYSTVDGKKGLARVIAIDLANDLALVQTDYRPEGTLPLSSTTPVRGEGVYALGFPNRQAATVTQGLYNGPVERRYASRYHFTGPLNAGMSGGPALNARGEVLGVNVESRRNSQLVSYLVPVNALAALLDQTRQRPGKPDTKEVERQATAYAETLIKRLLAQKAPATRIGNYLVPGETDLLKCSGSTSISENGDYETTSHYCSPESDIWVSDETNQGANLVVFAMRWRNLKENPFQFAQGATASVTDKAVPPRVDAGAFACRYKTLGLKGMRMRAAICVAKYRQFDLADYSVNLTSIDRSDERLSVTVQLRSMPDAAAKSFIKTYLESLSWQNATSSKS